MPKELALGFGTVSEMASDSEASKAGIIVPIAEGVDLDSLTANDEDPLFVTIDALKPGRSENKRNYSLSEIRKIAKQVLELKPNGYLGHLSEEEKATKYPDPVVIWIGATVAKYKGEDRLFIKGYVLPKHDKFRDYLKRALATGTNIAVSIFGQAFQKWNNETKGYDISEFDLESIDFARSGAEGMANAGFMQLTAEMNQQGDDMTREEVLQSVTVAEMKDINPGFVEQVENEATKGLKATVSEMSSVLGVQETDDLKEAIAEMQSQNGELQHKVAGYVVDRELGQGVPSVAAREMVKKTILSEMTDYSSEEVVKSFVSEMLSSERVKAMVAQASPSLLVGGGEDNREQVKVSKWIKGKE